METKDIDVNGQVFRCRVVWTVEQARNEIRSRFGLLNGGIEEDGVPVLGTAWIRDLAGSLTFVGGQPIQPIQQLGATGAGALAGPLPSPRYPNSVFIFGDTVNSNFQPVGTCFAISPQYLLTVRHNMESNRRDGYGIAPYASRAAGAVVVPQGFPRPVQVRFFNTKMDYAILEICDNHFDLIPIPISLEVVEADMDLKIYHCPVDTFNDEHVEDLTVFPGWAKTARPTTHHVACNVGLYCGSSGGPFISRNGGAVAMHVESVSTAKEIDTSIVTTMPIPDAIEIISDTVNSHANIHASFSRALLFRTCPQLIRVLQQLEIIN